MARFRLPPGQPPAAQNTFHEGAETSAIFASLCEGGARRAGGVGVNIYYSPLFRPEPT